MNLTSELVQKIMHNCEVTDDSMIDPFLFLDDKEEYKERIVDGIYLIKGICRPYYFDVKKLRRHRKKIIEALNELPSEFLLSSCNGGWSFLHCCLNRAYEQWGTQEDADKLVALGRAIGKVSWLAEEKYWHILYGGMPYLVVLDVEYREPLWDRFVEAIKTAATIFALRATGVIWFLIEIIFMPIRRLIATITESIAIIKFRLRARKGDSDIPPNIPPDIYFHLVGDTIDDSPSRDVMSIILFDALGLKPTKRVIKFLRNYW